MVSDETTADWAYFTFFLTRYPQLMSIVEYVLWFIGNNLDLLDYVSDAYVKLNLINLS